MPKVPKTHKLGKSNPHEKISATAEAQGKMYLRHVSQENIICMKRNLL